MAQAQRARLVIAVQRSWLRETLHYLLSDLSAEIVSVQTLDDLLDAIRQPTTAVIVDIFGYQQPYAAVLDALRLNAPAVPIAALLSTGTIEYRDAVVHGGANAVIVMENAYEELIPRIVQLLRGKRCNTYISRLLEKQKNIIQLKAKEVQLMDDAKDVHEQSGLSRRTFLKGTAAAGVSTAVLASSSGSIVQALAEGVEQRSLAAEAEEQIFNGVCRPNCWESCRLHAHVRNGRVVKVSMAPMADPRYNRICLRGMTHIQRMYHPDRLKYPMKRAGERGEDKWEQISWDEAISMIVDRFTGIREEYGDSALAFLPISGNYGAVHGSGGIAVKMQNALGATAIDPCVDLAFPVGIDRVIGGYPFMHSNEPADMANSRTIIVWGSNIAESQIHNWHFVADALEKGAKLVVIDPMFTSTAAKADIFVPIRPASDVALALSMMQVIIEEDLTDKPFLRDHTVSPFLVRADTKRFLRQSDITGEAVEEGEEDPFIVWDADADEAGVLAEVANPALEGTFEVEGISVTTAFSLLKELTDQYVPEEAAKLTDVRPEQIREIARLYATNTPSMLYPGFGPDHYDNGQFHGHALATLAGLTGNIGKPGAGAGMFIGGAAVNYAGIMFPPDFHAGPSVPILKLRSVIETGEYNGQPHPLKALYVHCANPLSNTADQREWLDHILPGFDFIVVADTVMTDSARYADLVLPVAHWFEVNEVVTQGNHPIAMIQEKAVEPAYEAKSDVDIMNLIAPGLGVGDSFTMTDAELIDVVLDSDALRAFDITPETLREQKSIRFMADPFIYGEGGVVPTATGRVQFYVEDPKPRLDYGQDFDPGAERLPYFRPPAEAWPENPLYEKYPLVATQEHTRWRVHTQFFNIPWLRELDPEPVIKLSPEDADARGIETGDYVEAYNDRGHVVLKAIVSSGMRPGLVNIPKGWQRNQFREGGYQELTKSYLNPVTINQSFFDVLVEVRKF
jgi:molybdopterin-containing oxidoreductase family molybdopterin binding subunit